MMQSMNQIVVMTQLKLNLPRTLNQQDCSGWFIIKYLFCHLWIFAFYNQIASLVIIQKELPKCMLIF